MLSQIQKTDIKGLRATGVSYRHIATILGVPKSTIFYFLEDPIDYLYFRAKCRIYSFSQKTGIKFTIKASILLGCDALSLWNHLQSQLKEGMTLENYGKWELDHIIPINYFDLSKPSEQHKCFNYKNLQPLWKNENWNKYKEIGRVKKQK